MRVLISLSFMIIALLGCANIAQCNPERDLIKKQKRTERTNKVLMEEGKVYFLEVVRVVNGVLQFSLVDSLKNPHKTIVASYQYSSSFGTIFELTNPFSQQLSFAGYVKVSDRGGYDRFDNHFIVDVYQKVWPFKQISSIMISSLELVD